MYLVVLALVSILLAIQEPVHRVVRGAPLVCACVAAAVLLPVLAAVYARRAALRAFERHIDDPAEGQFTLSLAMRYVCAALALGHGFLLVATDWLTLCASVPLIGRWPLVPSVLAILPLLLSIALVWLVIYPADRAVREMVLEMNLYRGRPVRPVMDLLHYLLYSARHQVLFVLVPLLLILAVRDVVEIYKAPITRWAGQPYAPDLLMGAATFVVALIAPFLLRRIWATQALPSGPLRTRLDTLARRLRLRCAEILVWRTGGQMVNAAVMGLVAPLRYVLITDGMLEQLDDTKIEAVFGHEAGHVRRHHILYFLMFAFVSGCMLTIFSARSRALPPDVYPWAASALGLLMLLKWWLVFGWISRRFERQADVYGVRALAVAGVPCTAPCAMHSHPVTPAADPLDPRSALCATAAQIFGSTLNDVAVLNGIPPEAPTWRHGSIASRSRLVQLLAHDPRAAQRFEALLSRIKLGIVLATIVFTAWAACEIQVWRLLPALRG